MKKLDRGAVLLSIGLVFSGALKIYLHYTSVWRTGPVDYLLGLAGVLSGCLLVRLVKSRGIPGVWSMATFVGLMAVSVFKILIDYKDPADVAFSLCITAAALLVLVMASHHLGFGGTSRGVRFWCPPEAGGITRPTGTGRGPPDALKSRPSAASQGF